MITADTTASDTMVAREPGQLGRRRAPPSTNGAGGSIEDTPER